MTARRRAVAVVLVLAVLAIWPPGDAVAATVPTVATADAMSRPVWKRRLDRAVEGRNVSVSVRLADVRLYRHAARRNRVPASNQKLLVTMALLEALDPAARLQTRVAAGEVVGSRTTDNLWLIGRGDPSLTGGGSYGDGLPFRPSRLGRLARQVQRAGIRKIGGAVVGARSYYSHDWWASGWRWYYPHEYVPLASAIAFEGNTAGGSHIKNPEFRAARALTRNLRRLGVVVADPPRAGSPPSGLETVASIRSVPVQRLVRYMNRTSSNFYAEMLGKRLAIAAGASPGSIAAGAGALERWASGDGVWLRAHDASGLSYDNRVSADSMTRLLDGRTAADARRVRRTLPRGGQGTLKERLHDARVRAKTGSLPGRSALSGYVYLQQREAWASFSILSGGMEKVDAAALEDRIVRLLEERAR